MNTQPQRAEHPAEPAEGSRAQGEEDESAVQERQQRGEAPTSPGRESTADTEETD